MKNDNEVSKVILKKLKVVMLHSISSAVWSGSKLQIDNIIETFEKQFRLVLYLPSEHVKTIKGYTTVCVPETWIDHLRRDSFPNFLNKKYPIKYKFERRYYEHEVGAIYPKLPIVFPKQEIRYYNTNNEVCDEV